MPSDSLSLKHYARHQNQATCLSFLCRKPLSEIRQTQQTLIFCLSPRPPNPVNSTLRVFLAVSGLTPEILKAKNFIKLFRGIKLLAYIIVSIWHEGINSVTNCLFTVICLATAMDLWPWFGPAATVVRVSGSVSCACFVRFEAFKGALAHQDLPLTFQKVTIFFI